MVVMASSKASSRPERLCNLRIGRILSTSVGGNSGYLRSKYRTHSDRADIYFYFVEMATTLLNKSGRVGLIVSNSFTRSRAGRSLRSFVGKHLNLLTLVEFGDFTPFVGATVYPIIIVAEKSLSKHDSVSFVLQGEDPTMTPTGSSFSSYFSIDQSSLGEKEWVFEERRTKALRSRLLSDFSSLSEVYGPARMGVKTGLNEAFIVSSAEREEILSSEPESEKVIKPYLAGKDLDRWRYEWAEKWMIYAPHGFDITSHPHLMAHLSQYRSALEKRATQQQWYELQQPQEAYAPLLDKPKIIYPDMSRYPKFSIDVRGMFFSNTGYFIASDSLLLLGLLNSKLLWFVVRGLSNALRGGLWRFRLFSGHIERLPIRTIDFYDSDDVARHDRMVGLVERMLALHERLAGARIERERTVIGHQISATDKQIDRLVYELYGLTQEEIGIVEEATAQ